MIRRVLVAAALAATALAITPTGPAQARACALGFYCITTYYSDNTHTTVVGSLGEDCIGNSYTWGVRSTYKDWNEYPC